MTSTKMVIQSLNPHAKKDSACSTYSYFYVNKVNEGFLAEDVPAYCRVLS